VRDGGNGNTCLHIAAQNGHFDLVKLLLCKAWTPLVTSRLRLHTVQMMIASMLPVTHLTPPGVMRCNHPIAGARRGCQLDEQRGSDRAAHGGELHKL
jgi:ankyrin repeat protein